MCTDHLVFRTAELICPIVVLRGTRNGPTNTLPKQLMLLLKRIFLLEELLLNLMCPNQLSRLLGKVLVGGQDNAYDNISVVQQCRMLEVQLGTNVVEQCLQDPDNALSTFRSRKNMLLKQDFNKLLLSALNSPSAHVIASIASQISWPKLWDLALDRGVKGTYAVQGLWQSAVFVRNRFPLTTILSST